MSSRHLIMGTSGHVDHGKTALIRLLTGIDTDRLKEERERGISIELGFAHLDLPSGTRLGIVDVPGHERFVKHMLAGAGGIDFVLLVVAADEGVMPQTVEHSQILELLGVERGLVALTKTDLVDAELVELVEEDVREFLKATPFEDWPIVRLSSTTGAGKEALVAAMEEVAATVPERSSAGGARLPIDRVFTVEGFGTVVTGTLWSGSIAEGDPMRILPSDRKTRIRQVQMHGRKAPVAHAGSRVALALHAIDREDIARGDWVMPIDADHPVSILDVKLQVVGNQDRSMKQRERVRFHLGASEVFGRVTFFDRDALAPGEMAVAQIRLEEPVVALRGDRFVLRWYSPIHTCAGGRVIDPRAKKRRRSDRGAVRALEALDSGSLADRIQAVVARRSDRGFRIADIAHQVGAPEAEIESTLRELGADGQVATLGRGRWLSGERRREIDRVIEAAAQGYQERYPLRHGIQLSEIRSRFQGELAPEGVDAAIQDLVREGRAFVRDDRLRVGSADAELPEDERATADRIVQSLESKGFKVPTAKELLAAPGAGSHLQELLAFLVERGEIVRLNPDLCYTRRQIDELVSRVIDHFRRQPAMTVTDLKHLLGVSRKYAVPLLEYLDDRGLTRRSGDARVPGRRLNIDPTSAEA